MQQAVTIRVATFNVENLFSRFTWPDVPESGEDHVGLYQFQDPEELKLAQIIVEAAASDDKRQLTALALMECDADLVCLQEVDNVHALRVFYERYIKHQIDTAVAIEKKTLARRLAAEGRAPTQDELRAIDRRHYYDWRVVIEGNDGRGIDVGVMSRREIKVTSHAQHTFEELGVWAPELENYKEVIDGKDRWLAASDRVFRRDCLEVDLEVEGHPLTLFVCHLKSMGGSRRRTYPLRLAEAKAVRKIIETRFAGRVASAPWLICGDFNDFVEIDGVPPRDRNGGPMPSAIDALLADSFSENLAGRREPLDRWTTYHGPTDVYAQLDFILASPGLARLSPFAVPTIVRGGQPYRAKRYSGPRYPRIGWDRPKASDHCPVVVEITVGTRAP